MSFFGKPSGGEPRITYERIDLSAPAETAAEDGMPAGSARAMVERLEPRMERARPGPAAAGHTPGIMLVAADSEMEGCLRSRGVVRVEGVLRGSVHAPILLIEVGGLVEGSVTAERVRSCGALRGSVTAREIEIVRTAMVDAELIYDEISIERGARVSGMHRQREPEPAPAAPPSGLEMAGAGGTEALPVAPAMAAAEATVLATAAVSTAALVAEAEAALHSLAQATQAAAEAVEELAQEGVPGLVELETELRATPEQLLSTRPVA